MPKDEIDEGRNAVGQLALSFDQIAQTAATFLITDLGVAMTLIRIAGNAAEGSEKRNRNRANARRAYDAVSRISAHVFLAADDRQVVDERLAELRSALEQLGEVFKVLSLQASHRV